MQSSIGLTSPNSEGRTRPVSRRRFVVDLARAGSNALLVTVCSCSKQRERSTSAKRWHPEPRPGVDGSMVLARDELQGDPRALRVFDMVREIPETMDGIRCHCNCAVKRGMRSLLACFEGEGMARDCDLCLQQATRVYQLQRSGMPLEQIRIVVDAAFA